MKNLLITLVLFIGIIACSKKEDPKPVTPPVQNPPVNTPKVLTATDSATFKRIMNPNIGRYSTEFSIKDTLYVTKVTTDSISLRFTMYYAGEYLKDTLSFSKQASSIIFTEQNGEVFAYWRRFDGKNSFYITKKSSTNYILRLQYGSNFSRDFTYSGFQK